MQSIKQWFESLYFAQPSYFDFFYLTALMAPVLAAVILLKLFYRPQKSKYSVYKTLGRDAVWLLAILICALCIIALAGPKIISGYSLSRSGSVDVLVWIDETFSMKADDIKPSRQEMAKRTAINLIDRGILAQGDRVTLFAFGDIARWRMPLSEDLSSFKEMASEISHPKIYEEESQLNTDFAYLLEYAPRCLDRQDNFARSNKWNLNIGQRNNNRVVFMISDGNNEGGRKFDAGIRELNKRNVKVYSIAIGTKTGARVMVRAYNSKDSEKPSEKLTIYTRLETKELERIAQQTRGSTFILDSESKQKQLEIFMRDAVNSNRSSLPKLIYSTKGRDIWWEILAVPTVLLLILVIWLG